MRCCLQGSASQAQKHQQRAVEPQEVVIGQVADPFAETAALHGGDLVDHQAAGVAEPVFGRWLHQEAQDRGLNRFTGQWTHRDRERFREAVVLNDHGWPGLAGVARTTGDGPDFTAPHWLYSSSGHSVTESMKAWMSASSGLALASRLCRLASAANSGECTSGTQIWIGRIPWARRRWRCSATLRRLAARRAAWGSTPGAASASMAVSTAVTCHLRPLWPGRSASQGDDLSLNRTKELVYEEVEHRPPLEIWLERRAIEQEILQGIEELEGMLR